MLKKSPDIGDAKFSYVPDRRFPACRISMLLYHLDCRLDGDTRQMPPDASVIGTFLVIVPCQQKIKRKRSEHLILPDRVVTESNRALARRLHRRRILELIVP